MSWKKELAELSSWKLIILCIYDPWAKMPNDEQELDREFTLEQAELRALLWLTYRPNDLVMLVDNRFPVSA